MRLKRLGGVAAIALLATMGSASAFVIDTFTTSPLENLGTGTANSRQSIGQPFTVGAETFTWSGGSLLSGVYAGNMGSVAASPFGAGDSTSNYLLAGGSGGTVTVSFTSPQTGIELLWSTVDSGTVRNVLTADGQMITGDDIIAACIAQGHPSCAGMNVEVEITGLTPFTSYTVSDGSAGSFEFVPGTPVPEPASLATLGAALAGLGILRRRNPGSRRLVHP